MSNDMIEGPSGHRKDIAAIERQGILGQQTVTPLSIQGNQDDSSDGWVHEWSRFFSLPVGRVEAVGNIGLWVSISGLTTLGVASFPILLLPAGTIITLLGITTYSSPKLAPMALMRLGCIMAGISLATISVITGPDGNMELRTPLHDIINQEESL